MKRITDSHFEPDTPASIERLEQVPYGTTVYEITETQLNRLRNGEVLALYDGEYMTVLRLVAPNDEGES